MLAGVPLSSLLRESRFSFPAATKEWLASVDSHSLHLFLHTLDAGCRYFIFPRILEDLRARRDASAVPDQEFLVAAN